MIQLAAFLFFRVKLEKYLIYWIAFHFFVHHLLDERDKNYKLRYVKLKWRQIIAFVVNTFSNSIVMPSLQSQDFRNLN